VSDNKNQTAAARAKAKAAIAGVVTKHSCHSCRGSITHGELQPVMVHPKRKMVMFHRDCWEKAA
jgi:hypothetical protein